MVMFFALTRCTSQVEVIFLSFDWMKRMMILEFGTLIGGVH